MIKLDDYDIFRANRKSLKELSKDDSDNRNVQYMTESTITAVDFDKVKRSYVNSLGISEDNAASVDGISYTTEAIAFIEFKNGSVNNRNVKDKVRDSLLIFCDITKKDIEYTRQNAEFVLVYNEAKNPLPNQYTKGVVQSAPSRTYISKRFAQMGKQEFILFDLERYKNLYFRDVHTYSKEEFEDYQIKLENLA